MTAISPKAWTREPPKAKFIKAINKGLLKIFSKMGISTVQSYCGAQIFEAIGLNRDLVDRYFTGTPSRVEGIGLREIGEETLRRHRIAYEPAPVMYLDFGGEIHYRVQGEHHNWNPETIDKLQHATKAKDAKTFAEFSALVNDESVRRSTSSRPARLQVSAQPISIDEVEPATEIMKRFNDGGDVVRIDQQGSARNLGDRDESHRRQEQHRRRRGRPRRFHSLAQRRFEEFGASSRWRRPDSA